MRFEEVAANLNSGAVEADIVASALTAYMPRSAISYPTHCARAPSLVADRAAKNDSSCRAQDLSSEAAIFALSDLSKSEWTSLPDPVQTFRLAIAGRGIA